MYTSSILMLKVYLKHLNFSKGFFSFLLGRKELLVIQENETKGIIFCSKIAKKHIFFLNIQTQ